MLLELSPSCARRARASRALPGTPFDFWRPQTKFIYGALIEKILILEICIFSYILKNLHHNNKGGCLSFPLCVRDDQHQNRLNGDLLKVYCWSRETIKNENLKIRICEAARDH